MEGASGPEGRHLVLVPDAGEASGPSIRCQGDMSSTNRSNRNGSRVDASATRYATENFPDVTAPNFINFQSFYRHSIYLNSWHALSNGLRGSVGRASHWRSAKCIHNQHETQDWHFWHQDTIVRPKVAKASQFEPANAGTVYHLKFDRTLLLIAWNIFFIKLF